MSRSRKRSVVVTLVSAPSEKQDKRRANRRLRAMIRILMSTAREEVASCKPLPLLREVSNRRRMAKDGRCRLGCHAPIWALRK